MEKGYGGKQTGGSSYGKSKGPPAAYQGRPKGGESESSSSYGSGVPRAFSGGSKGAPAAFRSPTPKGGSAGSSYGYGGKAEESKGRDYGYGSKGDAGKSSSNYGYGGKGEESKGRDYGYGGKSHDDGKGSYKGDRGYDGGKPSYAPPAKGGGKSSWAPPVAAPPRYGDSYPPPGKGGYESRPPAPKGGDYGYAEPSYKGGGKKREREDEKGYDKGFQKGGFAPKGDFKGGKGGKDVGGKGGKDAGKGGGKNGGKSKTALKVAAGEKLFNGVIRMFNPEKKSGFIDCKDTQYQFAQDVYVFQDVLERGLAGPGDKVCFFLHWSAKGQPQASSPLLRIMHSAEGQYALKGHYKPREGADFGFIICEETREFFDRDVYVNKDIAVTLEAGQPVSFNCYLNRDGLPNAEEVVPCEEEWLPVPGDLSIAQQVDTGKGKGKGKGGKGDDAGKGSFKGGDAKGKGGGKMFSKGRKGEDGGPPGGKPELTGRLCTGMIKSFNQANNYGFIDCEEIKEEFGSDVFMHGKELNNLQVGEQVQFEVGLNSKGQPQALSIVALDAAGEPPAKKQRLEEAAPVAGDGYEAAEASYAEESYPEGGVPAEEGYPEEGYPEESFPEEAFPEEAFLEATEQEEGAAPM